VAYSSAMALPRGWLLLLAAVASQGKPSGGGSKSCSHTGFYPKKIVPLCENHFPDISSKHPWLVQFYHPGVRKVHDQRDDFEQLASKKLMSGGAPVKVGAVDCAQNGEFCAKQGISQAPTTRAIHAGNSRELTGEHTLAALEKFVEESGKRFKELDEALRCEVKGLFTDAKKDSTIPLCTSSFPPSLEALPWVVSFYESGDRNKDKTMKGTMNRLAEKNGNSPPKKADSRKVPKVRFGAIDCSEEKNNCGKFGVSTFPTVRWYQSGVDPVDFDSFFDSDELKTWISAKLKAMPKPEAAQLLEADMAEGEAEAAQTDKLSSLKKELEAMNKAKAEAAEKEDFAEAKKLKAAAKELEKQIKKLEL